MLRALSSKNKKGFVDGFILAPSNTDPVAFCSWTRNNDYIVSWILNSVSKEIAASIIYANTAKEVWQDLQDHFQQSNSPKIFQLRRELMNLC